MELAIPQHISRVGVYTGHTFLIGGILSVYYNFPLIFSIALFTTYSTTITHWYKLRHSGIIKTLDIAAIINLVATFYFNGITRFCPNCQCAWISTTSSILVVYFINTHIFYYQTSQNNSQIMKPGCYSYFSLAYTLPNSRERELCYYYNSYIHCIFLHVVSMSVSIYCTLIMPPENNSSPIYNALYDSESERPTVLSCKKP